MSQPVDIDLLLSRVRAALAAGDWEQAVRLIESLRPPDQADLFGELPPEEQDALLPRLDVEDSADILEELEDSEAAEVASRLDTEALARILDEMEPDEAADLLGDIHPAQAIQALSAMEEADEVEPLLAHPDETAGGLMTTPLVTLRQEMTAEEAIALPAGPGPRFRNRLLPLRGGRGEPSGRCGLPAATHCGPT
jgi:magnesium transporter